MSWIKLEPNLLKNVLAEAEIIALANVQKPFNVDKILTSECHNVAEIWRSKIRLIHRVDKREDYVPEALLGWILIHLRYVSFTRLPNMGELLDQLRVNEWNKAIDVLNNLKKYSIDKVEDGEEEEDSSSGTPVVIVPWQNARFE